MNRWCLVIFLFPVFLLGDDDLNKINKLAQVYTETAEYSKAIELYSKLPIDSLQPWQLARLHYNLGVLKLAQKQPEQALEEFLQINPLELSSPGNLKNLFFYEAIACLQQVDELKNAKQLFAKDKESYLLHKSLHLLRKAKSIPCSLQENENLTCEPSALIANTEKIIKKTISTLKNSSPGEEKTPQKLNSLALKQLLIAQNQAMVSLKMTYQLDLTPFPQQEKNKAQLYQQQKETLKAGDAFIPMAVKDQETEFLHKNPVASCLISKWNEVISLFDQGYQSAKNSLFMLSNESYSIREIMTANELTVQYWQQAIELLLSPPSPSSSDADNQNSNSPESINETIREIQEMFSQDRMESPIKAPQKELQSW